MPHLVSIYDLYDKKSFRYWEREIAKGRLPTSVELTALLNANRNAQLPVWLIPIIDNRDGLKRRTGRPRNSALKETRVQLAIAKYRRYLQWLKKRKRSLGLEGWSYVRSSHWWVGPPHERAARMVTARWLKHVNWRAFLNRASSP
jgi:hypothetical protein